MLSYRILFHYTLEDTLTNQCKINTIYRLVIEQMLPSELTHSECRYMYCIYIQVEVRYLTQDLL